jgi:hypothetical protein
MQSLARLLKSFKEVGVDYKPLCVKCHIRYKIEKNGVLVIVEHDNGNIYYAVYGDLLKCPKCGAELVSNFAKEPIITDTDLLDKEKKIWFENKTKKSIVIVDNNGGDEDGNYAEIG